MSHIVILSPLYNDEASFRLFAAQVEKVTSALSGYRFTLLVVDDGSDVAPTFQTTLPLRLIRLYRNIGHQKAIAVGLSYACKEMDFDGIIVMDGDGEDRPEDIPVLVTAAGDTGRIIFARRQSRQEGKGFKLFYTLYKMVFRLLTGKRIAFGNFMLLPRAQAAKITHHSEIWSHLAGGILKSKLPYTTVDTHRGRRYAGASKMNFTSLVLHGLGAIGVFIDAIATRLLVCSLAVIVLALLTILVVIGIRFFTDLAVPGWATTAVSSMLIVLLQSFLLSLFTIFLYLSSQAQRKFIPAHHYTDYVHTAEEINQ